MKNHWLKNEEKLKFKGKFQEASNYGCNGRMYPPHVIDECLKDMGTPEPIQVSWDAPPTTCKATITSSAPITKMGEWAVVKVSDPVCDKLDKIESRLTQIEEKLDHLTDCYHQLMLLPANLPEPC